jgi:hypothetical protein
MKKTKIYLSVLFCVTLLLWGCDPQNDMNVMPKTNMRSIVSFVLNPAQNYGNVLVTHTATINQSTKIITLKLPKDLRLDSIRPQLISSPWSSVFPNNLDYVDLRPDTVEYTVTAESGMKTVYAVVKDLTYLYTNTNIMAVSFLGLIDANTGLPTRMLWASTFTLPSGTNVSAININLELSPDSHNAVVTVSENRSPNFRPFSNPINFTTPVSFKVISEDGKKTQTYTASVVVTP